LGVVVVIEKFKVKVTTADSTKNFIEWEGRGDSQLLSSNILIEVSESPKGPFTRLDSVPFTNSNYIDNTFPKQLTKWATFYYKVTIRLNKKFIQSIIEPLHNDDDLVLKEMRRRVDISFDKRYGGQAIKIYKVKSFGIRCMCYDTIMRKSRYSNCKNCGGTTFVNGILNPIETSASISPIGKAFQQTDIGNFEDSHRQLSIGHFPLLKPGDLVYSNKGMLYNVVQVQPVEYHGSIFKQVCTIIIEDKGSSSWNFINGDING
jgi:hypothetical protein